MPTIVSAINRNSLDPALTKEQQVLQASMPQLVPFYFVNETTFTWILLPTVIYILSKYVLPQQVRKMAARLFISKL